MRGSMSAYGLRRQSEKAKASPAPTPTARRDLIVASRGVELARSASAPPTRPAAPIHGAEIASQAGVDQAAGGTVAASSTAVPQPKATPNVDVTRAAGAPSIAQRRPSAARIAAMPGNISSPTASDRADANPPRSGCQRASIGAVAPQVAARISASWSP